MHKGPRIPRPELRARKGFRVPKGFSLAARATAAAAAVFKIPVIGSAAKGRPTRGVRYLYTRSKRRLAPRDCSQPLSERAMEGRLYMGARRYIRGGTSREVRSQGELTCNKYASRTSKRSNFLAHSANCRASYSFVASQARWCAVLFCSIFFFCDRKGGSDREEAIWGRCKLNIFVG